MSRCTRFEEEGLLILEQGLELPPHFDECPDCRQARARYERLKETIATSLDRVSPPAGWQAETWKAIDRDRRPRWKPQWTVPVAVAAAAILFLVVTSIPSDPPFVALSHKVVSGSEARRGSAARQGDRVLLTATTGGADHAEIRVYRGEGRLIIACSKNPPCTRGNDRIEAEFVLQAIGRYQPLLLVSEQPIPPPDSDLDADTGAALASGAQVEFGEPIIVR